MLGSCTIGSCGGCEYFWEMLELDGIVSAEFSRYDKDYEADLLNYQWHLTSSKVYDLPLFFCESCHNGLMVFVLFAALKKGDMRFECNIPR